jgi:DNA (cytosine-5)-methyltransferase 1
MVHNPLQVQMPIWSKAVNHEIRVLDLFSGIGGFSLGLERAGPFRTVAFCEREPFPQAVLRKHWPEVPIYEDVRTIPTERLGRIDLICGGFPCQPWSVAGQQRGAEDDRDLWPVMAALIEKLRPRWVVGENVRGFVNEPLGLQRSLSDLEGFGYQTAPFVIPACAVDAPHRRDRVWIVAHADTERHQTQQRHRKATQTEHIGFSRKGEDVAHAPQFQRDGGNHYGENDTPGRIQGKLGGGGGADDVAHAHGQRSQGHGRPGETRRTGGERQGDTGEEGCRNEPLADPDNDGEQHVRRKERPHAEHSGAGVGGEIVAHAECVGQQGPGQPVDAVNPATAAHRQAVEPVDGGERGIGRTEPGMGGVDNGVPRWLDEPDCGRVVTGVKNRAARLKALGNAVVPQVVEQIGRAILEAEGFTD